MSWQVMQRGYRQQPRLIYMQYDTGLGIYRENVAYCDEPLILVRSLVSVGGTRPGRNYTRRLNRRARAMGFHNWRFAVQALKRRGATGVQLPQPPAPSAV
jgi:hypothetical protein